MSDDIVLRLQIIARELDEGLPQDAMAIATILASADEIERLREALEWYGENARLCRLIHSEGDAGRNALANDGGERSRAALGETGGDD